MGRCWYGLNRCSVAKIYAIALSHNSGTIYLSQFFYGFSKETNVFAKKLV